MGIYESLYDFITTHIFNFSGLDTFANSIGIDTSINVWLSHTTTIIIMVLMVVVLISFLVWLFKLVSGFILLKR